MTFPAWKRAGSVPPSEHDTGRHPVWRLSLLEGFSTECEFAAVEFATRDLRIWSESPFLCTRRDPMDDLLSGWTPFLLRLKECTIKAHRLASLAGLRQAALCGRLAPALRKESQRIAYLDLAELALVAGSLRDGPERFVARAHGAGRARTGRRPCRGIHGQDASSAPSNAILRALEFWSCWRWRWRVRNGG